VEFTFYEMIYTLIGNNCPDKQARFLPTLKNLAAISLANLITFNLKEKLCVSSFILNIPF
jgi:hypothetical protein